MRRFNGNYEEQKSSVSRAVLKAHFDHARQNGLRYVVVIEERLAVDNLVLSRESVFRATDEDAIIRAVRSKGLRPDAPHTYLARIFDTQRNFKDQFRASFNEAAENRLSAAARDAYHRYLNQMYDARTRKNRPAKGIWGWLIGNE